jgi:hypothetical protein
LYSEILILLKEYLLSPAVILPDVGLVVNVVGTYVVRVCGGGSPNFGCSYFWSSRGNDGICFSRVCRRKFACAMMVVSRSELVLMARSSLCNRHNVVSNMLGTSNTNINHSIE